MKTQTQAESTARPWQSNGEMIFHQRNAGGRKTYVGVISFDVPAITAKANASLIVQAVNQFDALNAVAEIAMRIDNGELSARDSIEMAKALSTLETLRNNH